MEITSIEEERSLNRGTFANRNQLYTAVFDLLPLSLRERAFIAGGAAVDVEAARDIDLWVLASDLAVDGQTLRDYLLVNEVYFDPIEGNAYGEIVPGITVVKFGVISEGFPKPVQICLTPDLATPEDALATFDLSVHQHAFTPYDVDTPNSGFRYHHVETSTTPDDAIVILRTTTPEWTYQRYIRLVVRYGQRPSIWQIGKLGLTEAKQSELLARLNDQEGIDIAVPLVPYADANFYLNRKAA